MLVNQRNIQVMFANAFFLVACNKLDAKQVDKQPVTVSKHHNWGKIDVNKSL